MDLRDYLRIIRARMWLVIVAVVVTFAATLAFSLMQDEVYEAEADLLISESNSSSSAMLDAALSGFSSQPERSLQTQVRMMKLRPVFERTIRSLDLRMHPDALADVTEVTAQGQTNVVSVSVRDGDAKRAALLANTIASEYELWVREFSRARIRAAADEVESQLDDVRADLVSAGESMGKTPTDEQKVELQLISEDYAGLSEQLRQLRIREQMEVGPVQVINTAAVPKDPIAPRPFRNSLLGLAVGIMLGLAAAFLAEALDHTVKSPEQAAELTGSPIIGIVPLRRDNDTSAVAMSQTAASPVAEAFRGIRNSLDFINFEHDIKTVLVTSALPGEGKSTVSSNLAVGLARAGHKVVLISVDFHRPKSALYLGASEALGLSHVLSGQYALDTCLQTSEEPGLTILASGKVPPNPSEMLGSERMGDLVAKLAEEADWVVLDGPPVLAVADTTAVAKWVDGVIMVVRSGRTSRDALSRSIQMLGSVGAKLIGTVLLGVRATGGDTSAYGYSYKYSTYVSKHSAKGK